MDKNAAIIVIFIQHSLTKKMRKLYHLSCLVVIITNGITSGVSLLTGNPPIEGIDGVLYKFARSGQPTTLVCQAITVGSADICRFIG